jgi:hypothetical protein
MTDSELEGEIKKAFTAYRFFSSRLLAVSIRAMGHHTTETQVGRTLKAMEIRGKVIRRASNGEGSPTWQLRQTPQQEATR